MPAERIARHQRSRLEGAMVEAVSRHGYHDTTLRELARLAGVSKSTFYEHFASKEECFLSTFDEIVRQLSRRVALAFEGPGEFRDRLRAAVDTALCSAAEEPAAASLVAVDSLALGRLGVPYRERAAATFEAQLRRSFERERPERPVSERTVRAIIAGVRGIVYHSLRAGTPERLPDCTLALTDWALSYQLPESEAVGRAAAAAAEPLARPPGAGAAPGSASAADGEAPDWDEAPDSELSRTHLSQRERIVRGTARVVLERGYQGLSIPAISAAAGVSNQTFYEHFKSKCEAFLAAFEVVGGQALEVTAGALAEAGEGPESTGVAIRALLEFISRNEMFARLAFFELPTAGADALDSADRMLAGFSAFLSPGVAPPELGEPPPQAVIEVIPGGIWAVIQHEIVAGRSAELPSLAPELTRIALQPFGALGLNG